MVGGRHVALLTESLSIFWLSILSWHMLVTHFKTLYIRLHSIMVAVWIKVLFDQFWDPFYLLCSLKSLWLSSLTWWYLWGILDHPCLARLLNEILSHLLIEYSLSLFRYLFFNWRRSCSSLASRVLSLSYLYNLWTMWYLCHKALWLRVHVREALMLLRDEVKLMASLTTCLLALAHHLLVVRHHSLCCHFWLATVTHLSLELLLLGI